MQLRQTVKTASRSNAPCRRLLKAIVSRRWFALECRISRSARLTGKSGLLFVLLSREEVIR